MKYNFPLVEIGSIAKKVLRPKPTNDNQEFKQAGIRLWGQGLYQRETITGSQTMYTSLYEIKKNDLIANKIWARNGSIAIVPDKFNGYYVSSEFPTFELDVSKINPDWMMWLTKTKFLWKQLGSKSFGTSGKNRIKPDEILSIKIPLPVKEMQDKILLRVNEGVNQIQNFKNLYDQQMDNINKIRQSILYEAVQGKLVPQDPNDEPASKLLRKIKAEKEKLIKEGKIKKENPIKSVNQSETPYKIKTGWEWCRLSEISQKIHYGFTASADYNKTDIRLLRITDIQNNYVNWSTVPGCEITKNEANKYLLYKNDILIARTGGTIGKTYIINDVNVNSVFASYLIRVIPSHNISASYLKIFLESPFYWKQLKDASSATGQPNVNATSLCSLLVSLPPLNEQERIVEKVNKLMKLCNELEYRIQESQKNADLLMQAVLQESFEKN